MATFFAVLLLLLVINIILLTISLNRPKNNKPVAGYKTEEHIVNIPGHLG